MNLLVRFTPSMQITKLKESLWSVHAITWVRSHFRVRTSKLVALYFAATPEVKLPMGSLSQRRTLRSRLKYEPIAQAQVLFPTTPFPDLKNIYAAVRELDAPPCEDMLKKKKKRDGEWNRIEKKRRNKIKTDYSQ